MRIDRRQLVRRHNPVLTAAHPVHTLTVGNGDLAMTVDLSGLQTFPEFHELRLDPRRVPTDGASGLPEYERREFSVDDFQIPLRTQSTWGWYETRTQRDLWLKEAETNYPTSRGMAPYLDRMGLQRAGDPIPDELAAGAWFHYNPRRLHLGRLTLDHADGSTLTDPSELSDPRTELDLWSGSVHARYMLRESQVDVITVADPREDRFAVRVVSSALADGLAVSWRFDTQPDDLASFELPLHETTSWQQGAEGRWTGRRGVESTSYTVEVSSTGVLNPFGPDGITAITSGDVLEVAVALHAAVESSPGPAASFSEIRRAAAEWWEQYWTTGSAASLEGSTDERAAELERRIVLSQYLTAVNGSGQAPPAETGLTYNTWTGKHHLEMHWWHAAHFPLWGRGELLERSLGWYHDILPAARATAVNQGYRGARWPKQTDLSGRESPSHIGVFLVWQQPHIIHLLELLVSEGRGPDFLEQHYPLVEATADFMADFVDERGGAFTLPPPLIPAQESYLVHRASNADPTFELAYWSWALSVANRWRRRLDLPVRDDWDRVASGMRRPLVLPDGTYAALATPPYLVRKDHPSMLMALGWLPPTEIVDPDVMTKTLDGVWTDWDLQSSWGWDYAAIAMTAAALGDLDRALSALVLPSVKNHFVVNGHNPQMPGFLTLYLPANGGLLAAMAHVAAAVERGVALPSGWELNTEGFQTLPALLASQSSDQPSGRQVS